MVADSDNEVSIYKKQSLGPPLLELVYVLVSEIFVPVVVVVLSLVADSLAQYA